MISDGLFAFACHFMDYVLHIMKTFRYLVLLVTVIITLIVGALPTLQALISATACSHALEVLKHLLDLVEVGLLRLHIGLVLKWNLLLLLLILVESLHIVHCIADKHPFVLEFVFGVGLAVTYGVLMIVCSVDFELIGWS